MAQVNVTKLVAYADVDSAAPALLVSKVAAYAEAGSAAAALLVTKIVAYVEVGFPTFVDAAFYEENVFVKGATRRMASGALVREQMLNTTKRRFIQRWAALTATERDSVLAVCAGLSTGGSMSFTAPDGGIYTVVLAENGAPKFSVVATKGGTVQMWAGSLTLEEV